MFNLCRYYFKFTCLQEHVGSRLHVQNPLFKIAILLCFYISKRRFYVFKHTVCSLEPVLPTGFREKKRWIIPKYLDSGTDLSLKTASGFPAVGPHLVSDFPARHWAKYFAYFTLTRCTLCWMQFFFLWTLPNQKHNLVQAEPPLKCWDVQSAADVLQQVNSSAAGWGLHLCHLSSPLWEIKLRGAVKTP